MPAPETDQLRSIKSFPWFVKYRRDELGWPVEAKQWHRLASYTLVLRMPSARGEIAPCLMKPMLLP